MTNDDLNDPAFIANPHPTYAGWRADDPVRRVRLTTGEDAWMVTGYREARAALAEDRLSKAPRDVASYTEADLATNRHMLASDPPDHTRLRKLVTAAFTHRRIEAMRPRIVAIADGLLDEMTGDGPVDLIGAYAFPLPVQVICELLGIPVSDRDSFRTWSAAIVAGADATGEVIGPGLQDTVEGLTAYLKDLVALRRVSPGDDLLSALVRVRDREDRLSDNELTSMAFLLLVAGHETTMGLISNGTFVLLEDREHWERLRADRGLLPNAVEEFLRYESSVETSTGRVAVEDFVFAGHQVRKGDLVMVGLLAANRDPAQFEAPDVLSFERTRNQHLAFGHGIHHCLGAPLARLEAVIAFDRLLARFPEMRLAAAPGDLPWRSSAIIRGLQRLPVLLR
ncbi:cytochrome P450 family protein [Actinoplanes couchii]|uniref:Cytochrome P450 hydroxylase n=1 Tax=Actinoplanes couchii TaxID=403638 RepID=A0ABQ3XS04_9ACTN|nr:cytochrome P450 [Actinoplanes couchii]MDR6318751.1 cytochrome P450 [Actinoplanes couchii]GID61279.1 cytochrome P450 hydroxylase [Actinoplanes couchii]